MTYYNSNVMMDAFRRYKISDNRTLYDVYRNPSRNKRIAMANCYNLHGKYGYPGTFRVISFNCFVFSVGFIGEINGKRAFFYITRDYTRYCYLSDMGVDT